MANANTEMRELRTPEHETIPEESAVVGQEEGAELLSRLHREAQNRYEKAVPSRGKTLWGIILVVALLTMIGSLWGAMRRFNEFRTTSQQETRAAQAAGIAFASQTSSAQRATAAALGTEEARFSTQQAVTSTANAQVIVQQNQIRATAQQGTAIAQTQVAATANVDICQLTSSYKVRIVSGPRLYPTLGYNYVIENGDPLVRAYWEIKNNGSCDWTDIQLQSMISNETITPILRINGRTLDMSSQGNGLRLSPGGQIELVVDFVPLEAQNVKDEWMLVINGLLLSDEPHLSLDVQDWIIPDFATPTPTKTPRPHRPEVTSTKAAPPVRSTNTPPPVRP